MGISLKRIVEQQGANSQFYDLGRDFSNFRRTIDGSFDQIKQRFEQIIGEKLNGKRVRARASRGYKQYVKDYEFDVSKVTLDDYYDNYVVVAHDNTTPKSKEYFLKPGFKIQVLGPASGQASQGVEKKEKPQQPMGSPTPLVNQPKPIEPIGSMKEAAKMDKPAKTGHYDAYSIDAISQDIKPWLLSILRKPDGSLRDFIAGLGWLKDLGHGKSIALFDLKLPLRGVKVSLNPQTLQKLLHTSDKHGTIDTTYELVKAEPDVQKQEMLVRVKKTMIDKSAV